MYEYIIALVLILVSLVYFLRRPSSEETPLSGESSNKKSKSKSKSGSSTVYKKDQVSSTPSTTTTTNKFSTHPTSKEEEKAYPIDSSKLVDTKEYLLNSFREAKDLMNPFISRDGKTILFHDDRKIFLGFLNNFEEKNPKFLSKSVDHDVISDASYSEDKK